MTIKTFCDPFFRAYAYLEPSDIKRAIEKFGLGLVKLYINPMYLKGKRQLDYTFPENIIVEGNPGVAGWELQGEVRDYTLKDTIGTKGEAMTFSSKFFYMSNEEFKDAEIFIKDKNSIPPGQVPEKETPDKVLNRPDKVLVASGVKSSPADGKEHLPVSDPSQDFDCSASTLKNSDKTPRIMKQGGGRPRKIGDLSKRTLYRRKKELAQQKEMLPL